MRKMIGKIHRVFQRVVASTSARRHSLVGNPKLWKMKRDFQVSFLKKNGLQPSHYILDLGCGTLRGGIPLIQYLNKGRYYGLEARGNVLVEARKELMEANLGHKEPILLLTEDASTLPVEFFDFIWAFSVLIHMNDEKLDSALNTITKCIGKQGVFFANVNVGAGEELEWQGFPVVRRPLEFYKTRAGNVGLKVDDLGALKLLGHISGKESQDSQHMLMFSRL